jgi:hypothetical protein
MAYEHGMRAVFRNAPAPELPPSAAEAQALKALKTSYNGASPELAPAFVDFVAKVARSVIRAEAADR